MKTLDIIAVPEYGVSAGCLAFSWEIFWADGVYMGPQEYEGSWVKRIIDPGWDGMGWFAITVRF